MLIPAGRKKMLEIFLKDPFKEIHLREIARQSKSSIANVDNSMRLFVKNDMFKRNEMSHSTFFKPNLENDETIKIFELLEYVGWSESSLLACKVKPISILRD